MSTLRLLVVVVAVLVSVMCSPIIDPSPNEGNGIPRGKVNILHLISGDVINILL